MSPKEIIKNWVVVFNNGDASALADFYSENAINHQVNSFPVEGKAAIEKMFIDEFALTNMVCIIENIFESGDCAILEWRDPDGLRGCGVFEFEKGKIKMQRGYWDKLSFLRIHKLPFPTN